MRSPELTSKLPAGKPWLKIDLLREGKKLGIDLGSLSTMQSSSPSQSLQWLRTAGGASVVGHERIHGVRTTHYRGTLDLTRLPDVAPSGQREAVRKSLGALRKYLVSTSPPFDTWIDKRGRVRRLQEQMVEKVPSAGAMTMFITFDLYDFGARAKIDIPADSQTIDAETFHP
jgi:hypothetical protein